MRERGIDRLGIIKLFLLKDFEATKSIMFSFILLLK